MIHRIGTAWVILLTILSIYLDVVHAGGLDRAASPSLDRVGTIITALIAAGLWFVPSGSTGGRSRRGAHLGPAEAGPYEPGGGPASLDPTFTSLDLRAGSRACEPAGARRRRPVPNRLFSRSTSGTSPA